MLESKFKTKLKKELTIMFPGCIILDNDANRIQGIPDLLILYGSTWAALEGKRYLNSSHRPNQDYYVELMNDMSYASFICPENCEEILDELEQTLIPRRTTRVSKRQ